MPEAPGALLFDMDGVLLDSNPVHAQAWVAYNRRFGVETDQTMLSRMYGRHNAELLRDFLGAHLSDAEVAAHGAAKEALYREMMAPQLELRLLPGLRQFLARHAAMPMGVATNAERPNVDLVLRQAGLQHFFPVVVDGNQVARPKPSPDIYLKAAALLGVEPARCIVFEDSHTGVAAGRAAGMPVVALRTTHREFRDAQYVMDDFLDTGLERWLGNTL